MFWKEYNIGKGRGPLSPAQTDMDYWGVWPWGGGPDCCGGGIPGWPPNCRTQCKIFKKSGGLISKVLRMSTKQRNIVLQMVLELDTRRCAIEEAEPQRGWTRGGCQHDARPWRGWIGGSHIDWRREWVSVRTLGSEGEWIVRSHIGWEENETFFVRVWKPLPSKCVLKTLTKRTIFASGGLGPIDLNPPSSPNTFESPIIRVKQINPV